eukprot:10947215-Lingulodinium_polyedra.AAC.2
MAHQLSSTQIDDTTFKAQSPLGRRIGAERLLLPAPRVIERLVLPMVLRVRARHRKACPAGVDCHAR